MQINRLLLSVLCSLVLTAAWAQSPSPLAKDWAAIDNALEKQRLDEAWTRLQALTPRLEWSDDKIRFLSYKYALIETRHEDLAVIDSARFAFLESAFAERPDPVVHVFVQFLKGKFYQEVLLHKMWGRSDNYPVDAPALDYRTMSTQQLFEQALGAYTAAVADTTGLLTPIGQWPNLVNFQQPSSPEMPYLYDLMATQAVSLVSNLSYSVWSFDEWSVDWQSAMATPTDFMAYDWGTHPDPNHTSLLLLQRLMRLHKARGNRAAFLYYDLARLKYALGRQAALAGTYIERLTALEKQYEGDTLQADVLLGLGEVYAQLGNQYDPYDSAQAHKWARKTAFDYYEKAIREYPDTYGGKMSMNRQAQLMQKTLEFSTERVLYPGERSLVSINYRNLSTLHAKLVLIADDESRALARMSNDEVVAWLNQRPVVRNWTIELPNDGDLHSHRTEWILDGIPAGEYILMLSDNEYFYDDYQAVAYQLVRVSQLAYYSHSQPNERPTYFVVDRNTGQPLTGVEATFFDVRYDYSSRPYRQTVTEVGRQTSTREGIIQPTEGNLDYMRLVYKGDTLTMDDDNLRNYVNGLDTTRMTRRVSLFTDRAIYRPGQTIHFKGIAMRKDYRSHPSLLVGDSLTVTLFNGSGQAQATLSVVTNEFGTFSGTFTAPSSLLGTHSIVVGEEYYTDDEVSFRVEEYKRPTFKTEFKPLTSVHELGDSVTLTGTATAYAGYPLAGINVTYRVEREAQFPHWRWWWGDYPGGNNVTLTQGQTTTAADGTFHIPFVAIPDSSLSANGNPQFQYTVIAEVTDLAGESHDLEYTVTLSTRSLQLSIDLPAQVNLQEASSFRVKAQNGSGQPQSARGTIHILALAQPDRIFKERMWRRPDTMMYTPTEFYDRIDGYAYAEEGQVHKWLVRDTVAVLSFDTDSAKAFDWAALGLEVGYYRIIANSEDAQGRPVQYENMIETFDPRQPQMPSATAFWWHIPTRTYQPGDEAVLYFGGAGYRNYTMIEVRDGMRQVIHREWVLSRNLHQWRFPITEAHRGNLRIKALTVAEGRVFEFSELVRVPWKKDLDVQLETFRDRLSPGQKETWTLKIADPDGRNVEAELLASLYDASLDAIYRTEWSFNPFPYYNSNVYTAYRDNFTTMSSRLSAKGWQPSFEAPKRVLPQLELSYKGLESLARLSLIGSRYAAQSKRMLQYDSALVAEESISVDASRMDDDLPPPAPTLKSEADKPAMDEQDAPMPPRTNLDETVFFKPHLRTDSLGRVAIEFTMNEALTTWKLRLLAHTRALDFGYNEATTVTQKNLMVQPFAPRYLRQRDTLVFSTKVTSLLDSAVSGAAELRLIDAVTGADVSAAFGVTDAQQSFDLSPKGQTALGWTLRVPADWQHPVRYRVTARASRFQDGEESVLPVLSDRLLITEAQPLLVRGRRKARYTFGALDKADRSRTLATKALTLQFTQNPAWDALKAMPYLMEYPYECSEQVFNRFFAHSLAANVVRKAPRVTAIMEAWRTTDSLALRSQLQQNEALKTALLAETPWVLAAQSETEQMQHLADLFDLVALQKSQQSALATLEARQMASGAFPWFNGGQPSRYITQYLAEGMGHLAHLGVKMDDDVAKKMSHKAVLQSDAWIYSDYEALKSQVEAGKADWSDDHLSATVIQYLYMRSFYKQVKHVSPGHRAAYEFYLDQAATHWTKRSSIYELGMLALVLNRNLAYDDAQDVVEALRQRSKRSKTQGMYWQGTAGYYWYELPIETQALMVEVFNEVARDEDAVSDLKLWLLRQKKAQQWSTTKGTAAAIYALLVTGSDWLAESQPIEITLGDKRLDVEERAVAAGTGSFTVIWPADSLAGAAWSLDDFKTTTLKNPNRVPAWGAMYWQYFEDYDAVEAASAAPLQVTQKLYKRINTAQGATLVPLADSLSLSVGDRVTLRITLRTNQMMEYVHLKAMRGTGLAAVNALSGYQYRNGLGFYESPRDAATDFFFDYLPKGTYTFDVDLKATHSGQFSMGVTTVQSMYAPEFSAHTSGSRIVIEGQ